MTEYRLFLALWPPPAVRDAIAQWQQAWTWPPKAALVTPERLHLTLHFLGNVPVDRLPELATALRVGYEPFELRAGGAEVWPKGVAVLWPAQAPDALLALHAALGTALRGLELPVEDRPFRAHITLARRAHAAVAPSLRPLFNWDVRDGYVLARSLPGGGYQTLEHFDANEARG